MIGIPSISDCPDSLIIGISGISEFTIPLIIEIHQNIGKFGLH
jgi:hypothetical protein